MQGVKVFCLTCKSVVCQIDRTRQKIEELILRHFKCKSARSSRLYAVIETRFYRNENSLCKESRFGRKRCLMTGQRAFVASNGNIKDLYIPGTLRWITRLPLSLPLRQLLLNYYYRRFFRLKPRRNFISTLSFRNIC